MASDKELSDFLKSVEKRAFKRTVYAVRDDEVARMSVPGGAEGYVRIAAQLLAATFGRADGAP